jgi:CubicO group peptidase (beta-lactamase class C family)
MKQFLCIFFLLFSFFSCQQQKTIATEQEECFFVSRDASLDSVRNSLKAKQSYLSDYYKGLNRSGVFKGNVLVAEKGQIVYMESFGYVNDKTKKPLTLETSFQLASVTKIFTAVAILQLHEKGLLNLDDKVKDFIPELPYDNITIRHLLSHRSGLPRYEAFDQKQWDWTQPMTNNDMIALYAKHKPNLFFKPGKSYDYSNAGFALLASVVERITAMSFHKYLYENIFVPSGMKQAFVFDIFNPPATDSIAFGHARAYRFPLEPQQDYLNGVVGDKGVYASVLDLYKFDLAMTKNKLLKPETQELAFERTIKKRNVKYDDYGFGHRLKDWNMNGDFIPYHSGWWRGFKTLYIRDIYRDKTVIVLSNHEISPQAQLSWNVLEMI